MPNLSQAARHGDRKKIKDTRPRSVLALKGSAPRPHPWLTPIPGRSSDAPQVKDRDHSAAAIQPSAPGSQQLLPDSEREV